MFDQVNCIDEDLQGHEHLNQVYFSLPWGKVELRESYVGEFGSERFSLELCSSLTWYFLVAACPAPAL